MQQLLLFFKLMAEALEDMPAAHPGCLVASFTYEAEQFDDEVRELNDQSALPKQILQFRSYVRLMFGDV